MDRGRSPYIFSILIILLFSSLLFFNQIPKVYAQVIGPEPYENIVEKEVQYIWIITPNQHVTQQFVKNHSIMEVEFTYLSLADEVSIAMKD
jgi:hypothetical protein